MIATYHQPELQSRSWIGVDVNDDVVFSEGSIKMESWIYDAKSLLLKSFTDQEVQNRTKDYLYKVV